MENRKSIKLKDCAILGKSQITNTGGIWNKTDKIPANILITIEVSLIRGWLGKKYDLIVKIFSF